MDNEQDISFEEFEDAFSDGGNQTEVTEEVETETEEQEGGKQGGEETPTGEEKPSEQEEPGEEKPEETKPETFTLKVNKEEKTYSREEMISLAQKGADYDRVKELLEKSRTEQADMKKQFDSQKEAMELLAQIAKDSGSDVATLLENMQISMVQRRDNVSADVAKERVLRQKAERQAEALRSQKQEAEKADGRAKREIEEFRKAYPDVDVTQELIDKLMPEVTGGKSLLSAYRQMEEAKQQAALTEKDSRIAELEKLLAAEKKNKENRAASPGSQKDTGGQRQKTDFDDFMSAFG